MRAEMKAMNPARNDQTSIEQLRVWWDEQDKTRGLTCDTVAAVIVRRCVLGIPGESDRVHHIVSQSREGSPLTQAYILGGQRAKLIARRGRLRGSIQLPLGILLSDDGLRLSRRKMPASLIQCILEASEKRCPVGDFIRTGIPELDAIIMEPSLKREQRRDYAMVILRTPQTSIVVR